MHELSFADAARPSPVVVLNLPLADYSLGHELLLFRRRNALALLPAEEFAALPFDQQIFSIREAVWLCSDAFSVRDRIEQPSVFMLGFRWSEWKRRRWVKRLKDLLPEDYALAAAEFRNYLAEAHPKIPTPGEFAMEVLYPDETGKGRAFGQPLVVSLYQYVITLPSSERPDCAWDFPMAKAMWLFYAHMEMQGNYRIENWEERDEQSVMDEAREQGRSQKSEDSNSEPETTNAKPSSGLATPPPDLSSEPDERGNA